MNNSAPMIILSPLIDPDGVPMQGLAGEPLAADEQGIVYTLRDDGPPELLGELAPTEDGRLILIPMNGLGASASEKDSQIQLARCRRALARSRRKHWQRRLQHLSTRISRGQASGRLSAQELSRLQNEQHIANNKLELAKTREAEAESALSTANALPLSGDDDMAGLAGRKRFSKKFLKQALIMAATGGAAAPFLAASRTRQGRRMTGRFLNDDGTDPTIAGDEMPVSTQVGGMDGLGASWWSKNRDKIVGFGAGAASAALVASGASKGSGLNTLINQGWDATKGFFLPQSQGGPAPAPAPTAMPMAMPAAMPMAMPTRMTVSNVPAAPMPMTQAGIGGIDTKTILLISGLGLGALVLLRPKR